MQVHPAQVSPGESFDIFYFLRNHTDAATYYVRARVYDIRTGAVLRTVALSQSAENSRLFIASTEAPPDPTGYGRNIVAIATVYTDSDYTTKSEAYEEQEQYFLVKAVPPVIGGGGISANTARDIFKEEFKAALESFPKPEPFHMPDQPDMSFVDALFGTLGALTREIGRIPKESPDLQPLGEKLDRAQETLSDLRERPSFERTDLSSIAEILQTVLTEFRAFAQDQRVANAQLIQTFEKALKTFGTDFEAAIGAKIEETIQSQEITLPLAMTVRNPKKQAPEGDPMQNIRSLMN